jgi:D-3-phosphoglycerate dehydrogenase
MKTRVLVTGALHPDAITALKANPRLDLTYAPDCPKSQLVELVAKTQVLISRSETDIDRELIDLAPDLSIIARAAVGVGNIDIPYATERGILVINTPGKNTNSAAELTMGLLLAMVRKIPQAYNEVKRGGWDRHRFSGRELRGKTIGIVGLGHVGHRVAKFARGFDMTVLAYDPYIAPQVFERHGTVPCATLHELTSQVDFLTVHVPKNKETTGMISHQIMADMKDGACIVNAARGGVVDEKAMLAHLKSGKIKGYGVDTWDNEPHPLAELVAHENTICTPHIGASTEEAQKAIADTIVEQVEKALSGNVVDYPVNLPQIGVIDNPLLKPYAVLAEKVGSLAAQLIGFQPTKMEMFYRGDLAGVDQALIRLGFVKGYMGHVVDGYVSYVNASQHFDRIGVPLVEKQDPAFASYRSALKVRISGSGGKTLTLGGIVFDKEYLRISMIDDYYFEVDPTGCFIISENVDKPGVIGQIGTFLGTNQINIDSFDLSRQKHGGKALAMIKVDSKPTQDQIQRFAEIPNILWARVVTL